jgi:hypothetical protein
MEAVKATPPEAEAAAVAVPSLGAGETPPIPAAGSSPAPALLRDASGGMGAIPFLTDAYQAEPSQLVYTLNTLIGAINARLGLIQPSAVKPEEKHTTEHPAAGTAAHPRR